MMSFSGVFGYTMSTDSVKTNHPSKRNASVLRKRAHENEHA
jgi:hypothetical protein